MVAGQPPQFRANIYCLEWPIVRLQLSGGPVMQAWSKNCLMNYVRSPLDFWLTAIPEPEQWYRAGKNIKLALRDYQITCKKEKKNDIFTCWRTKMWWWWTFPVASNRHIELILCSWLKWRYRVWSTSDRHRCPLARSDSVTQDCGIDNVCLSNRPRHLHTGRSYVGEAFYWRDIGLYRKHNSHFIVTVYIGLMVRFRIPTKRTFPWLLFSQLAYQEGE